MKEFFRQHGLRILAVAAAVAVALSLLTYFSSTSSVLENIAGMLTYPFRAAATAVSDWAADKRQYYEDTTTLKEENAALKKEIADLRAQQRQAQADSEENKLLRELLKLQQQRRDFTFVSTAVLAHSESSWTSSLSLNHGTDQDIAVGDCVVSAEGYLVGVISEVGLNWSTVLTVIDTDTELGARIFRTGEVAVAPPVVSVRAGAGPLFLRSCVSGSSFFQTGTRSTHAASSFSLKRPGCSSTPSSKLCTSNTPAFDSIPHACFDRFADVSKNHLM